MSGEDDEDDVDDEEGSSGDDDDEVVEGEGMLKHTCSNMGVGLKGQVSDTLIEYLSQSFIS